MKQEFRERKQAIRNFMAAHYTDERLAMLLAHAQEGRLAFDSCCCFIGVPSAPHALASVGERAEPEPLHHRVYGNPLPGASEAEQAFNELGGAFWIERIRDARRRRILIPMIKAEMKRRAQLPTSLASIVRGGRRRTLQFEHLSCFSGPDREEVDESSLRVAAELDGRGRNR
jgi:hypothetical protein